MPIDGQCFSWMRMKIRLGSISFKCRGHYVALDDGKVGQGLAISPYKRKSSNWTAGQKLKKEHIESRPLGLSLR